MKIVLFIVTVYMLCVGMLYGRVRVNLNSSGVVQTKQVFDLASSNNVLNNDGAILTKEIQIPITDVRPFLAVGIALLVERGDAGSVNAQLRYTIDHMRWSELQPIVWDDESQQNQSYSLQFLPKETKAVQFIFDSGRENSLTFNNVTLTFINPGETSGEMVSKQHTIVGKNGSSFSPPAFVSRTQWGCPEGQTSPDWMPLRTTVTHLIVHHTATSNVSSDWGAVVRSIWVYHSNTLGWGDIGYNWLIDPNGVLYQGRAWYNDSLPDVRAGHFCGILPDPNGINNNEQTMGVSMIGTYMTSVPTPSAITSLKNILLWKATDRNILPNGISYHTPTGLMLHHIAGHRDGCSTDCPGDSLYAMLPAIRNSIDSAFRHSGVAVNGTVNAGWNLFSLPVEAQYTRNELFPSGSSSLFGYSCSGGYSANDTPVVRKGYWVKSVSPAQVNIAGVSRTADTIQVGCDWNLLGSLSQTIIASSVHTIPAGLFASSFFGFDASRGYYMTDTLKPFQAYWVKVIQPCMIMMSVPGLPAVRE